MKSIRRVGLRALVVAPAFFLGSSCTDLTEVPHDALTPTNAFKTEAELLAGVAGVYANLRSVEWVGYLTLQDITTDVMIIPTRGNDWYDNGRWLEIHRQTWTANSGSALDDMNGSWNNLFAGVAKANLMIDVVTKAGGPTAPKTLAELRTLRAWFYYMLGDMFGGVPLATTTELKQYPRVTRDSLFKFIESEINASIPALPVTWDASGYGRLTKGAANSILASLYLNAGVFGKETGVSATAYNSCMGVTVSGGKTGCQAALDMANAVINSGTYTLNPDWSRNFANNRSSPENIFVIVHSPEQALGGNWPMRTLHYNQLNTGWGSPWNGIATLAETYNAFSPTDVRKSMWLAGQAKSFETGANVNDRNGNPLIFTTAIPDAEVAGEGTGVRFNKFPPLPSAAFGDGHPYDFPFFRLSEIYLIKAEALNELGQTAAAIVELKRIHDLRDPGTPIAAGLTQAQVRDAILKERLLEFAGEGKRRTDMIRHGKFLSWTEASLHGHVDRSSAPHLIRFPIPATQLQSNPLLTQNPGY
jgi:starch-binding outer membrane protein, SusD/RagB family